MSAGALATVPPRFGRWQRAAPLTDSCLSQWGRTAPPNQKQLGDGGGCAPQRGAAAPLRVTASRPDQSRLAEGSGPAPQGGCMAPCEDRRRWPGQPRWGGGGGRGAAAPMTKGLRPPPLPGRAAVCTHVVYHDGLVRYHIVGLHGEDPPQPPVREQQPSPRRRMRGAATRRRLGDVFPPPRRLLGGIVRRCAEPRGEVRSERGMPGAVGWCLEGAMLGAVGQRGSGAC